MLHLNFKSGCLPSLWHLKTLDVGVLISVSVWKVGARHPLQWTKPSGEYYVVLGL